MTEAAYGQIVDLKLNNVVVMGYRNYAGTSDCTRGDGVVCLDDLGPVTPQGLQVLNETLTTNLGGFQALFDGNPAPMVLAYSGQPGVIVRFEIKVDSTTTMQVVFGGVASAPVVVPTTAATPAIFTADSSGKGQGAILNQDYSYNRSSNPAAAGLRRDALPDVLYAGSAVGIVSGVIQINLLVPNGLSTGSQPNPVQVGGIATPAGVTGAVR